MKAPYSLCHFIKFFYSNITIGTGDVSFDLDFELVYISLLPYAAYLRQHAGIRRSEQHRLYVDALKLRGYI